MSKEEKKEVTNKAVEEKKGADTQESRKLQEKASYKSNIEALIKRLEVDLIRVQTALEVYKDVLVNLENLE